MVKSGESSLFLCMRSDISRLRIAADLDSLYDTNIVAFESGIG